MDSMIHRLHAHPEEPVLDIVVESAAVRLRPIVLTTVATVIGMAPLAYSDPTWGPLAFAIMFGLTFAIILTLGLVPALFYRYQLRLHDPRTRLERLRDRVRGIRTSLARLRRR
jgi:multidrug efflux pump subunit AcrB